MVYWGYVSQSTEQNELALSESVTTGTSEKDIVETDKIYCNTVANGLSNGAMPDTKKPLKKNHPLGVGKNMWKRIPRGGGYSTNAWVVRCGPGVKTLTLFP